MRTSRWEEEGGEGEMGKASGMGMESTEELRGTGPHGTTGTIEGVMSGAGPRSEGHL